MSRPTRKIAGAEVSAMGVGAMSFAEFYGPTTEENSWAVLDAAMELGVTHIDTSNVYGMGRSEEAIGAYLRRNGAAREVFHIATKAGISKDAAGNRCFDNSPEHLEAELDRSLSRMGIEAVDLFYVHRREEARPIEEVTATLVALRDKGKIKGFGFSEIAPASLRRAPWPRWRRCNRNIRWRPARPNWVWCRNAPARAPRWWPFRRWAGPFSPTGRSRPNGCRH